MSAILKIEHLTGKKRKFHLTDINLELEPGFIYAIAGENGAGKSTLIKTILSEHAKYDGAMYLCGENIKENRVTSMERIGYVSEDAGFYGDRTGKENANILGLLYGNFDMQLFEQRMAEMKVSTHTAVNKLSRGEKMKFQMAFAMAHKPKLYLLDEATAGMDPVFRIEFFDILRGLLVDEDCAVLMSSHNMTEITKQTDYVAVMENGQIGAFRESLEGFGND